MPKRLAQVSDQDEGSEKSIRKYTLDMDMQAGARVWRQLIGIPYFLECLAFHMRRSGRFAANILQLCQLMHIGRLVVGPIDYGCSLEQFSMGMSLQRSIACNMRKRDIGWAVRELMGKTRENLDEVFAVGNGKGNIYDRLETIGVCTVLSQAHNVREAAKRFQFSMRAMHVREVLRESSTGKRVYAAERKCVIYVPVVYDLDKVDQFGRYRYYMAKRVWNAGNQYTRSCSYRATRVHSRQELFTEWCSGPVYDNIWRTPHLVWHWGLNAVFTFPPGDGDPLVHHARNCNSSCRVYVQCLLGHGYGQVVQYATARDYPELYRIVID